MNLFAVLSIVALVVSLGVVGGLVWLLLRERRRSDLHLKDQAGVVLDPVVREAQVLKANLGPLLAEVNRLYAVVQQRAESEQDRRAVEARIKRLEAVIQRLDPGANGR